MPTECRAYESPTPPLPLPLTTNSENGHHIGTNLLAMAETTTAEQAKIVELDDTTATPSCDKRKLSPDISPEQANGVVKKLKDTKTQPGKCVRRTVVVQGHRLWWPSTILFVSFLFCFFPIVIGASSTFQTRCASAPRSVRNECRSGPKTSCSRCSVKWTTRTYKISSFKSSSKLDPSPTVCSAKRLRPTVNY